MRQQEAGTAVAELIRKLGIRDQTFYRCKKKYAGGVSAAALLAACMISASSSAAAGIGRFRFIE